MLKSLTLLDLGTTLSRRLGGVVMAPADDGRVSAQAVYDIEPWVAEVINKLSPRDTESLVAAQRAAVAVGDGYDKEAYLSTFYSEPLPVQKAERWLRQHGLDTSEHELATLAVRLQAEKSYATVERGLHERLLEVGMKNEQPQRLQHVAPSRTTRLASPAM
ncbi:MAG: hypothetical protein ACYDGM_12160 [Vulcanimicrobiaceae bacterium]